jgi:hypothetical protein
MTTERITRTITSDFGFGPETIELLRVDLAASGGCESCGAEEGEGWVLLPDAEEGTGFGVVATCTACVEEAAG